METRVGGLWKEGENTSDKKTGKTQLSWVRKRKIVCVRENFRLSIKREKVLNSHFPGFWILRTETVKFSVVTDLVPQLILQLLIH